MLSASSASASASAAGAPTTGTAVSCFSLPTFHCPAHIQLHPYSQTHTLRKWSLQRIQSDSISSASSSSSSTCHPQLHSVRVLGILQPNPVPVIQIRTAHGTEKITVITFQLCDDSGHILIDCPLSLLFAQLNLASKRQWMEKQQQSDTTSNQQFNAFVLGLLPPSSSVVEVCGSVEGDSVPPSPNTSSSANSPRVLLASAIRWIHTPTPQTTQKIMRAQEIERETLGREHYFRTTPLPSSHPPKLHTSPSKLGMSTPSLSRHTATTNTTISNTTKAPIHTPAATHSNSAAAATSPSLPLPLPLSLSQSSQPTSLFDDFASSQEERAHFALADQAAHQFVQNQQQQLQQRVQQQPLPLHPSTPGIRQSTSRQSMSSARFTHPPLHPPTGSPVGVSKPSLGSSVPSPASSVISHKPTFNTPRPLAASTKPTAAANISTPLSASFPEPAMKASSSGFQTGSGKSVAMSAAAMERAAKLQRQWEAEEEAEQAQASGGAVDTNPPGNPPVNIDACSSGFPFPPVESSEVPPDGFMLGFATGGGKRVEVSDAARKRAEKMMAEIEAECDANRETADNQTKQQATSDPSTHHKPIATELAFRAPSAKPFRPPASLCPTVQADTHTSNTTASNAATLDAAPRKASVTSNKLSKLEMLELEIAQMEDAGDAMELDENLALQLKPVQATVPTESNQNSISPKSSDRTTSPLPPTVGFLSGAGKSLALSGTAKERAMRLQQQWEKEEEQIEHKTAPVVSSASAQVEASPVLDFQAASRRCRVVKLQRKKSGEVIQDCDVYIGREENRGGWNLARSKWCNPFQTVAEFESYLMGRSDLLAALPELKWRTLGCWCKVTPATPCHGDVLVKLVNALEKRDSNSSPLTSVAPRAKQVESSKRQLNQSLEFQSSSTKPVPKSATEARLSKFQLELMKELEMDEVGDNIIDFATSSSSVDENGFGSAGSLSQSATFSSGFAIPAKVCTDSLVLPASSLSGEKRKLSQIPEENTQELLNAATPSLTDSIASNAEKSASPSPANSAVASLPALTTPLALVPRIAPPTTVQTISSATFSVDSTSSPPIKRTRYEPNTITTVNQSPMQATTEIGAPPPTPIPIASFDAVSPATPPRDSSVAVMSDTPASSEKLTNSQIRIPATPSLETPPHSLETEFEAAAAASQQPNSARKDAIQSELVAHASSCLPTDSYLPPNFFLTPPLSNLASEITTFASQL